MSSFTGKSVGTTIPLEIGVLTQLIILNLYSNRLIGTIPSSLGNLTVTTFPDLLAATSTPFEITNVQPPINWMPLPDEQLIDRKNTLQSFDAPPFTYDRAQNHQAAVNAVITTKQSSTKNCCCCRGAATGTNINQCKYSSHKP